MIDKFRRYLLDRMVLRPSRDSLDHEPQQRVVLRWQNRPLECFVRRNHDADTAPDVLVLKFPGTAGRAERSSDFPLGMLPDLRGAIWTWNPPGYGGSGGTASLDQIAEAAVGFWHQVTDGEADPHTPILLCGNSLGCVSALRVAACAASDHHRTGLILRNPPPLIPVVKRVADKYPLSRWVGPIAESLCDRMNAVITASQVPCPAVFLQSELDTLVPPAMQRQVIEAYAGEKTTVVLDGLSHGGLPADSHVKDIEKAIDWLWHRVTKLP